MTNDFALPDAQPEVEPVEAPNQIDPLYERQSTLGLLAPSVTIIGCGGVGCWVALSLVLGGVKELHLYDGDTLSLHNLNRFPLPPSQNGEMKSVALSRWLGTLRPDIDIRARGKFMNGVHNLETSWVVCATDSLKSRQMVYGMAIDYGAYYLEVGADGERWSMSPNPPEFQTELEEEPGYQTVPVHVGPCMMAGAAAAYYVLHNQTLRDSFTVDWDKGPVYRHFDDYGRLKFRSMVETPNHEERDMLICDHCSRQVEVDLITVIKHLREERSLSLLDAKRIAEAMIAEFRAAQVVNQAEAEVAEELAQDELDDEVHEAEFEEETEEARDEQTF